MISDTPSRTINFSGEYQKEAVDTIRSMIDQGTTGPSFIAQEPLRSTIGGTRAEMPKHELEKFLKSAEAQRVRSFTTAQIQTTEDLPCPFIKFIS